MSGMEASPLLTSSSYAPSWPVVQPPEPTFWSFGGCKTCLQIPRVYGCGGCRIPCYLLLAVVVFALLLAIFPILTVLLLILLILLGLPVSYVIVYLFFFSPPGELAWKLAKLTQLARITFYKLPRPSEWDMSKLRARGPLQTGLLQYAIAIRVPFGSEEELYSEGIFERFLVSGPPGEEFVTGSLFSVLPMKELKDMSYFKEGENPVQYVMDVVQDIYPKVIQEWVDKTSDRALTHLCLHGLGAHRMERADAEHKGCSYVVRTNQLATLPVRDGYETYGNDVYFDSEYRVVKILRAEPGEVWEGQQLKTFYPDGSRDWEYAKFCFRSSLFTLVTLVDHLYGTHLQAANVGVTAMREQLSVDHPVRRFLVPFTYGSISINDLARTSLVTRDSWLPRAVALDDEGLQLAWASAYKILPADYLPTEKDPVAILEKMFDREAMIEQKRREGLFSPYYQQNLRYWKILHGFVSSYLEHYYGQGAKGDLAMAADQELRYFMLQSIQQVQTLADPLSPGTVAELWPKLKDSRKRAIMTDFITRFCELASSGHEQVGGVQAYAQDPSFCCFSWPKTLRVSGTLSGPKEVGLGGALIMALTSTPMPKLLVREETDDWSHIFPAASDRDRAQLDAIFETFQSQLKDFSKECDDYNAEAKSRAFPNDFGLWVFNPKYLETSVSI